MRAFALTTPSIWLILSGALCVILSISAWQRRAGDFPRNFSLALLAIAAYSFGYALELGAQDLAAMQFALRIEYLGIPFISSIWTLMAYSYVNQRPMQAFHTALLFAIPVLTFLLFQTNAMHQLFYTDLAYQQVEGLAIAQIQRGPWYYVHMAYSNLCFFAYNALLLRSCLQAQPVYRAQALLLMLSSLAPWVCMLLFLFGVSPKGIDLNPFGLAVAGILSAVAVWRYKFLHLVPMARDVVFSSIEEGVVIVDEMQRIIDFNRSASRIFPQLDAASIGTPLAALPDGQALSAMLSVDGASCFQQRTAEGTRDYEIKHSPLRGYRNLPMGKAILIQDVSTRVALERQLLDLATHDELTGLSNRRHLMAQAESAFQLAARHDRPLSVLICDVDHFKHVNDSLGHLAGDALLRNIAASLQHRVRQTDVCGRYGGDEFVVVLPETGLEEARHMAATLTQHVLAQTGHGLSIGVACRQTGTAGFLDLLRDADQDLYARKLARRTERPLRTADPG